MRIEVHPVGTHSNQKSVHIHFHTDFSVYLALSSLLSANSQTCLLNAYLSIFASSCRFLGSNWHSGWKLSIESKLEEIIEVLQSDPSWTFYVASMDSRRYREQPVGRRSLHLGSGWNVQVSSYSPYNHNLFQTCIDHFRESRTCFRSNLDSTSYSHSNSSLQLSCAWT